jgi:8-oxo-dGTP pyrophosphatase MutT (NUDIX family)
MRTAQPFLPLPKPRPKSVTGPATPPAAPDAQKPLIPRDAATLVLVDHAGEAPRVLMGRRHPDMAFLANKFVFPGGRVDDADLTAQPQQDLHPAVTEKLLIDMRGKASPERARALAIAAIREVREETGLILGHPENPPLAALSYFARAITPPDRPRRFDTRFFMANADLITDKTLAGDGELSGLAWFTLEQTITLDMPGITRLIIEDIAQLLKSASPVSQIPFYYHRAGHFHRDLI